MTRRFERVVIAGVGLIGGSLALAAKRAGLFGEVVGLGRTRANLELARERGAVDRFSQDPAEAARGADLAILAAPVASLAEVARAIGGVLAPGAVVSDVGSVKARVVEEVSAALPAGVRFVGAHPIAGTEESGAGAAREDLYHGARCIVTPVAETDPDALARIEALWQGVGARVERMAPDRHDEILAWVSHVPHMLAFALMDAAPRDTHPYAGPSFRGITRVAASPVEMWRDIVAYNADAIAGGLDALLEELGRLRDAIGRGDADAVTEILSRARAARRRLDEGGS